MRVKGENEVNPFVKDNIVKMQQVDKDTSELCNGAPPGNLLESYRIVNETLQDSIRPVTKEQDKESLKFIYRHREYFKTLEYDHEEFSEWLQESANQTMLKMGLSSEMTDYIVSKYQEELEQCRKEDNID